MNPVTTDVAAKLRSIVSRVAKELRGISEETSLHTRGQGKWSRKEILGHVIDSAANNLHRFVRAQKAEKFEFPDYDQPFWVDRSGYADRPWNELVPLWEHLNIHLAAVIARIRPERLSAPCRIGSDKPVTLEFLVKDYLVHLQHHLNQILDAEGSKG